MMHKMQCKGRIINILPLGLSDKESESGNPTKKVKVIFVQRTWEWNSDKESESGNMTKKVKVEIWFKQSKLKSKDI